MGLDVYIESLEGPLRWNHPLMDSFPFKPAWETFEGYAGEEDFTVAFIPGIDGMSFSPEGSISFRGKGYSCFAKYIGLPYSFYDSLTTAQVQKQYLALSAYLKQFEGLDGHFIVPPESPNAPALARVIENGGGFLFISEADTLENIRNLCTLLKWVVENNLELGADY